MNPKTRLVLDGKSASWRSAPRQVADVRRGRGRLAGRRHQRRCRDRLQRTHQRVPFSTVGRYHIQVEAHHHRGIQGIAVCRWRRAKGYVGFTHVTASKALGFAQNASGNAAKKYSFGNPIHVLASKINATVQTNNNGDVHGSFGPGVVTGYVGFKAPNGDLGWIKVQVSDTGSTGYPNEITVLGWAYNDVSGGSIYAGQTSGGAIPEPARWPWACWPPARSAWPRSAAPGPGRRLPSKNLSQPVGWVEPHRGAGPPSPGCRRTCRVAVPVGSNASCAGGLTPRLKSRLNPPDKLRLAVGQPWWGRGSFGAPRPRVRLRRPWALLYNAVGVRSRRGRTPMGLHIKAQGRRRRTLGSPYHLSLATRGRRPRCSPHSGAPVKTSKKKVLFIGWDAADWKAIHPLMDAGQMPHLQNLVERGAMGRCATLHPPLSPMLWTSIATGKRPFKHGIHGFSEPTPDGRGVRPITNLSRTTKTVWNILNQNDYRSIVIGWWPSHPAEPINGVMVSDHYHKAHRPIDQGWPMLPNTVHPPELQEAARPSVACILKSCSAR